MVHGQHPRRLVLQPVRRLSRTELEDDVRVSWIEDGGYVVVLHDGSWLDQKGALQWVLAVMLLLATGLYPAVLEMQLRVDPLRGWKEAARWVLAMMLAIDLKLAGLEMWMRAELYFDLQGAALKVLVAMVLATGLGFVGCEVRS